MVSWGVSPVRGVLSRWTDRVRERLRERGIYSDDWDLEDRDRRGRGERFW